MNKDEIYNLIRPEIAPERLRCDEPMKDHTTFKIGGPADIYLEPDLEELQSILAICRDKGIAYTILGNGSNVLVSDKGIRGVTICLTKPMAQIRVDGTMVTAGAGARLSIIANEAAKESLTGMEFAAGIPGTLGGAVLMNAGAYGGEMKDILKTVTCISPDGELLTFDAKDLGLGYRHSFMMETGDIIVSARMELAKGNETEIRDQMAELSRKRMEKQPLEYPSAGSTFKRPEGYFAGKLIEDSGLRGYQVGDAMISEKHCGFAINKGNATAAEMLKLINDVQDIVKEKQGVMLQPEVRFLGEL